MNLASESKLCRDVKCERAGKSLDVSQFPRNTRARDGLHSYCRQCTRRRTNEARARSRVVKKIQKAAVPIERKPMVIAEAVENAITHGARTREQIASTTKLPMDDVCDALAVLKYDHGVIRFARVKGEACFYPVRAA